MLPRLLRRHAITLSPRLFTGARHAFFRVVPDSRLVHAGGISSDPFCPTIPTLAYYYEFLKFLKKKGVLGDFSKTILNCTLHNVNTNRQLLRMLLAFDASIFNIGKFYSDHKKTIRDMINDGINCRAMKDLTDISSFDDDYAISLLEQYVAIKEHIKNNPHLKYEIQVADGPEMLRHSTKLFKVAIQQTTQGNDVSQALRCPVVMVSDCVVKGAIESQLIVKKMVECYFKKLSAYPYFTHNKKNLQIGILGLGKIGSALLQELSQHYDRFIIYDKEPLILNHAADDLKKRYPGKAFNAVHSVITVLANADVIFGATGKSSIKREELEIFRTRTKGPVILVSCSSRTIEFQELIKDIAYENSTRRERILNPMADRDYQNGFNIPLILFQSGMPLPFDRSAHALPPHHADLVRVLKAISITFAHWLCKNKEARIPIDPVSYVAPPVLVAHFTKYWFDHLPEEDREMINVSSELFNPEYIGYHSGEHNVVHKEFEKASKVWLEQFKYFIEEEKQKILTPSFHR